MHSQIRNKYRSVFDKPCTPIAISYMFTFRVFKNGKENQYQLYIEKITHLLVLEQIVDGEEFPRYIRMTGQQVDRIKKIFFSGGFCSSTIPHNKFSLDMESFSYIFSCPEDRQVIIVPQEGMKNIYTYYEKHQDHIARCDSKFRSRR